MNGTIKTLRGPVTWTVNEKQVVVLKGKNLKDGGKSYSFIVRIDPPEEGLEHPVKIVDLICKFAESTAFKDELIQFCGTVWNHYLDSHPSVKFGIKRDIKITTNKAKIEQLRAAINKMSAQLEVAQAILKEIEV